MGTEEMGSVPTQPQRYGNNGGHLNPPPPQLLFHHDDTPDHRFPPLPKATRELTIGFVVDNHCCFLPQPPPDFRRPVHTHPWNVNARPAGDHGSDGDDDDDDGGDEELDDADGELIINNGSSNTCGNTSDKIGNNGSNRDLIVNEGNVLAAGNDNGNNNNARASSCENPSSQFQNSANTITNLDGDLYYSHQYQQGPDGSNVAGHKDASLVENGCGFSGRKDIWYSSESGESLRGILSDPLTGSLMDDAMILPCGHSFGGGGMQHVITTKACYACSQPVSEDSVATNLFQSGSSLNLSVFSLYPLYRHGTVLCMVALFQSLLSLHFVSYDIGTQKGKHLCELLSRHSVGKKCYGPIILLKEERNLKRINVVMVI